MKILMTGVSSFTGFHFANELVKKHYVAATFTKGSYNSYGKIQKKRIRALNPKVQTFFNINTNDINILKLINQIKPDVFCCHGSYMKDYNNINFNYKKAIKENTNNFNKIIINLKKNNCKKIIYTGSYFSPIYINKKKKFDKLNMYGLAKFNTGKLINKYSIKHKIKFYEFVIGNPFGPLEDEDRFASIIIKSLKKNINLKIQSPLVERDWIHINNLSLIYRLYIENFKYKFSKKIKLYPSQYRFSNKEFCNKLLSEYRKRKKYTGKIQYGKNMEINKRQNFDRISKFIDIQDSQNWKKYFDYYLFNKFKH